MNESAYLRFLERYESGQVPWDDVLPPPEVMNLVAGLQPGRALDLGCGYGRTSIYLAQKGWRVDGIDFVAQAIAEARHRAEQADVGHKINFQQASVAELGFLDGRYQLAVDVGCLHALDAEQQHGYRAELCRLLAPGAPYILFARLRDGAAAAEDSPSGLWQTAVTTLFSADFELQKAEIGVTQAGEKSWQSGWFWFVRKGDDYENSC